MKTLPATLKKQDLGACLSGVLFKISDGHPSLFYMGISPHLPGSEISAFVRFCLNPLLRWNKSEIKLQWLLNGFKKNNNDDFDCNLKRSLSLACDTILSLSARPSRVSLVSCTYNRILDVPRLHRVRLGSVFMRHILFSWLSHGN